MIYASTNDGGILIGLSAKNLELLRAGRPILRDHPGLPVLRIVFGETEQVIFEQLVAAGVLTKATVLKSDTHIDETQGEPAWPSKRTKPTSKT